MNLRRYGLEEVHDEVVRVARFRAPQRGAFDRVHEIIAGLDDDLPRIEPVHLLDQLREQGFHVPDRTPYFVFSLATGVGKTRLMGAILAYLFRTGQTRNALILAPRTAILDRLERISQVDSQDYLFLDTGFVPEPNLCFRGNLESFQPRDDAFNVFVLSPQSISGGDRRFGRRNEFRGASLQEYLTATDDLVVFTDEAHHLGEEDVAAWTSSIGELHPRLHFGLSATPRTGPGVNVLYSYDITTCLQEGLYTKAVNVIVDPRDEAISDDEWDRHTVDYAIRRLQRKREAIEIYANRHPDFQFVEPVALVCARDTDHADEIAGWLQERRGFERDQILLTHSQRTQTESEIARLVSIDQPGNRIRVVVNVFQLTEGWDVDNVYVIAPLRAMSAFRSAIQTMGRGLRLPAGRRVDDPDVDTLDILCFGRETLENILLEATRTFGAEDEAGPPVGVSTTEAQEGGEALIPRKEMLIKRVRDVAIQIPRVRRVTPQPKLDFDITTVGKLGAGGATAIDLASLERRGLKERVAYDLADVVRIAASRIIAQHRYLSDIEHGLEVENLVRRFLSSLGATEDAPLFVDPVRVAIHVGDEIDRRYRAEQSRFELAGEPSRIELDDVVWPVPEDLPGPMARMPLEDWSR